MKQKYYKSIAILFLVWAGCSMPVHVSGQVSAWNRTRTTGKNIFNYLPDTEKNPAVQKNRSNLIVYSDRMVTRHTRMLISSVKEENRKLVSHTTSLMKKTGTTVLSVPIKTL